MLPILVAICTVSSLLLFVGIEFVSYARELSVPKKREKPSPLPAEKNFSTHANEVVEKLLEMRQMNEEKKITEQPPVTVTVAVAESENLVVAQQPAEKNPLQNQQPPVTSVMPDLKFTLQTAAIKGSKIVGTIDSPDKAPAELEATVEKPVVSKSKKELVIHSILIAIALVVTLSSANAQVVPPSTQRKIDSTSFFAFKEVGVTFKGYSYNSFAPEWYLQNFCLPLSIGVFYKVLLSQKKGTSFRIGYLYSSMNIRSVGGKYPAEENTAMGKQSGSVLFAGKEKNIIDKGNFKFYIGAELALASSTFKGECYSYDGCSIIKENKKMTGVGINPFGGCSLTILNTIKIAAEASLSNWLIMEKNFLDDPRRVEKKNSFVTSPNPLNAVTVSYLF